MKLENYSLKMDEKELPVASVHAGTLDKGPLFLQFSGPNRSYLSVEFINKQEVRELIRLLKETFLDQEQDSMPKFVNMDVVRRSRT